MLLNTKPPADPFEGCSNIEAEQALIGCMLTKPHLFNELKLKPEFFLDGIHQDIYLIASEIVFDGGTLSPLLIGDRIGQKPYIAKIVCAALHVINPQDYANEIKSLWAAREMIKSCLQAQESLKSGMNPIDTAAELIANINNTVEQREWLKIRDNYQVSEEIMEDMKKDYKPISTGFNRIDLAMGGGLHPGFSYGFAARKKVGKTVLASSISFNLNNSGVHHLFIACEMGSKQIHQRNIARGAEINPIVFRDTSRQSTKDLGKIADYTIKANRCIHYLDAPGMPFDNLKQAVSMAVSKHKVSGIILDYWQLIGGKKKGQSTSEHQDEVAQWIADYCRKHGLWSIVMAQVNQEGNTRGGEGLRLAFDQVYHLQRDDVSMPGAWLEMLDTRYTRWGDVGSKENPGLFMAENSPYFYEM